jgi:branched-chain amino acid transport system ATP-binding protein
MTSTPLAARAEALLSVRDIHVYRGQSHVLQGVSLTLGREPLAIVGRNGMGKTTLCQTLTGLLKARSGAITAAGRDITSLPPFQIARAGIGYAPQGRRIFPSLTVREHMLVAGRRPGSASTIERIYQIFPRLAERRDHLGSELSGGEQQMLAIARALMLDPKILVLDEPTEGLAPPIVDHLIQIFRELASNGAGLLLVEQNLAVAARCAARIAVMVNGRIVLETTSNHLSSSEDLQRRYLGVGAVEGINRLAPPAATKGNAS